MTIDRTALCRMLVAVAVAWSTAGAVHGESPTQAVGRITLSNGETFGGALTGLKDGVLEWTHTGALRPFHFTLMNVSNVLFEAAPEELRQSPRTTVRLAAPDGGEDLFASLNLVSLDAGAAVMESPLIEGRVSWPRKLLRGVFFSNCGGATILDGPADSNGWFTATNKPGDAWLIQNGLWVSDGRSTISRKLELPDRLRVDFVLEMPRPLNFKLGFFSRACTNDFRESVPGYYLELRAYGEAVLQRADMVNRLRTLKATARYMVKGGRVHYTLLADREKLKFALLVNGLPACAWQDEGTPPAEERHLILMSMGKPQAVGGLTVRAWHGSFDAAGTLPTNSTEDVVFDIGGAVKTGRIASVADGKLAFGGGAAPLEMAKIERMDLAGAEEGAAGAPEWRILLADRSEIAAVPAGLDGDRLLLALPGGGRCGVRLADVRRMGRSRKVLTLEEKR